MIKFYRRLCTCMILCLSLAVLPGCSEEEKPLEGDRISVLELQKSLKPDVAPNQQNIILPEAWTNTAWPQAGGLPGHVMHNLRLDISEFKPVWKNSIGEGSSKRLPLTERPVVANGKVYTLDTRSMLTAFDAQNGNEVWRIDASNEGEDETLIGGGIAANGEWLYVTNGSNEVLRVNAQNGEIGWRIDLAAPSRAAPTVADGRVFVATLDNRLYALNEQNGTVLWDYLGIGESTGLLGAASPAAKGDIVVPVFTSGEITALRVENGSVAWSDNLANVRRYGGGLDSLSDIRALPIMEGGVVIAMSYGSKIAAIDERTGTRVWQQDIGGSETPWVSGSTIFALSEDNHFVALRGTDGAVLWVTALPRFEDPEEKEDEIRWCGPLMASGRLIIAGSNGQLLEIDPRNGKITGTHNIGYRVTVAPVIAGGMLYVLADDGTLIAYR